MVHLPGLVPDPRVVRLFLDQVGEDHEVVDQDLVHPPDRLERVQVVLSRLRLDVRGLAGQVGRCGVDGLAAPFEQLGQRVLGEPVDLDVGTQPPQLVGDGYVAAGVTEPDRRGEVEEPFGAAAGPRPPDDRGWSAGDLVEQPREGSVHRDRVLDLGEMAAALDDQEIGTDGRGDDLAVVERDHLVIIAVHHEGGTLNP
jgi:hypothetical protein